MTAPVVPTFLQERNSASSPKNGVSFFCFGMADEGTSVGSLVSRSADLTPTDLILKYDVQGQVSLMKRESSSPKNAASVNHYHMEDADLSVLNPCTDEVVLYGFEHGRSDGPGNSVVDQKKRGGISG
jgi:hypothetical protein